MLQLWELMGEVLPSIATGFKLMPNGGSLQVAYLIYVMSLIGALPPPKILMCLLLHRGLS
jgi:hypothetical protein